MLTLQVQPAHAQQSVIWSASLQPADVRGE